jgi:hypothetical protein
MNIAYVQILLVSIITFILYGFADALFFGIFLNDRMPSIFEKIGLTINNSYVMVGALSTSIALVVATYIKKYNKQLFEELIEHPALDIIGILVGAYIYILFIKEYRKL